MLAVWWISPFAAAQNTSTVLDCLRACNVAVRWLMLAGASRQAALAESVRSAAPDSAAVSALLLDTSLLEYEVSSGPVSPSTVVGRWNEASTTWCQPSRKTDGVERTADFLSRSVFSPDRDT